MILQLHGLTNNYIKRHDNAALCYDILHDYIHGIN